ncbi:MAG: hypothetical protein ACFCU4_06745 [Puniceicoccaceae bacterium]
MNGFQGIQIERFRRLLLGIWLGLQVLMLLIFGPVIAGDSERFLEWGVRLFSEARLDGWSGQFSAFILWTGLWQLITPNSLLGMVGAQIFLVFFALKRWSGPKVLPVGLGVLALFWFVSYPDFYRWPRYVMTEALFVASVMAVLAQIGSWGPEEKSCRSYLFLGVLVVLSASIRPHGLLWIPILLFWWVSSLRNGLRWVLLMVLALFSLSLTGPFDALLRSVSLPVYFNQGTIIWSVEDWTIRMPGSLDSERGVVPALILYGWQHPLETTSLIFSRVLVSLVPVRSAFSDLHNLVNLIWIGCFYTCVLKGIGGFARRCPDLARLCGIYLCFHLGLAGMMHGEWDGRWFLYLLPVFCFPAAFGLIGFAQQLREMVLVRKGMP